MNSVFQQKSLAECQTVVLEYSFPNSEDGLNSDALLYLVVRYISQASNMERLNARKLFPSVSSAFLD